MADFTPLSMLVPSIPTDNFEPAQGWRLYFFRAGTTTETQVYSDTSGTSLGTYVTLNARGEPDTNILLDTSVVYKIALYEGDRATEPVVWTRDNLTPSAPAGANFSWVHRQSATFVDSDSFTTDTTITDDADEYVWHVGRKVRLHHPTSDVWRYGTISNLGARGTSGQVDLVNVVDSNGSSASILNEDLAVWVESARHSITVDSVSDLQGGTFPSYVTRLYLSGYYGVGTPGGGHLYYDSGDTTTADNGVTVFVDIDGKRWKRPDEVFFDVTEGGVVGGDLTSDKDSLESTNADDRYLILPGAEYYPDDNPGTEEQGWVVHQNNMRIEGASWGAILTNDTQNQTILELGDPAEVERRTGLSAGWLTFKDQPAPAGAGSQNNEHPLQFVAVDNGLSYFNRLINCGLGVRFGRVETATGYPGSGTPDGGDGTRFTLALGTYFEDARTLCLEFMDDGTYGNQAIATRIANPDNSGNGETGATQSHSVRYNGRHNQVIGLIALDGQSDLGSWQGGEGHMLVGATGTGQVQAIQVTDTDPDGTDSTPQDKYSMAVGVIAGDFDENSTSYAARISESTHFILGNAIFYNETVPASSPSLGVHVLNNVGDANPDADSEHIIVGPILVSNTLSSAGNAHNLIEGHFHHIDLNQSGAEGGDHAIEIGAASSESTLDVTVDRAASSPADEDVRIGGTGHIGRVHGDKITIQGDQHILDIRKLGTSNAVNVSANDSIIRIVTDGPVTVSGSRNHITVNSTQSSGTAITCNGDNNVFEGVKDESASDTGTGNDFTAMLTY